MTAGVAVRILFPALALAVLFSSGPALGQEGDCEDFKLEAEAEAYHIYPDHWAVCPSDGTVIRCYHYHWDWICEKGDLLYWDRRLEAAARVACGCPLPEGMAQASPFVSKKPIEGLIHSKGETQ